METVSEKVCRIKGSPETMGSIVAHVANGGSLIELCKIWEVPYHAIAGWVYEDGDRKVAYERGLVQGNEWIVIRILDELKKIGLLDIRQLYDGSGKLKDVAEWPDEAASCVAGVDVYEEYTGKGEDREAVGEVRKLKLWDKIRALELLGKNLSMFKDRVDHAHHGKVSLEQLVAGSIEQTTPEQTTPEQDQKPEL